jgi:release factor glutamine methyltransferase
VKHWRRKRILNPKNDAVSALTEATSNLQTISETPRLDAELLLAHALNLERSEMLLRLRELQVPTDFAELIKRRRAHEPVAYIMGYQHFWDLRLDVSPAVLIPRADSETLIEAAQSHYANHAPPQSILDLGTGSGALLLAALSLFPDAHAIGVDASASALEVAQKNAQKLGFGNRTQFIEASWLDSDWHNDLDKFDLILCNPPYVESDAELAPQVRDHEPASALFAGEDGMDDYRVLIPQVLGLLSRDGVAIFEIGKGQDEAVSNLAISAGLNVSVYKDLADIVRALSFTAKASG